MTQSNYFTLEKNNLELVVYKLFFLTLKFNFYTCDFLGIEKYLFLNRNFHNFFNLNFLKKI